jgi:hypothetical protein
VPAIEGIEFNDESYKLIKRLMKQLKLTSDMVYPLPKGNSGKGQLRFAHYGPGLRHNNASRVFARFHATLFGATLLGHKRNGGHRSVRLSRRSFADVLSKISNTKDLMEKKPIRREKVARHKPGTVSGGLPETNRRRH